MDLGLKGLRAVVSGGSQGIGAAIVETLACEGCIVHFCGRDRKKIVALSNALNSSASKGYGEVTGSVVDVTNRSAVSSWLERLGSFDIAVANVSALSGDWEAAILTDLRGTVNFFEEAASRITAGGAITYVGSKASGIATPGFEAYGAVKAAMAHYTKSIASKSIANGVRVNVVSPGDTFVKGGFWDAIKMSNPQVYETTLAANPLGRLAAPHEIARVVTFISSPAASFVSGANWHVDGASTAHVQQ